MKTRYKKLSNKLIMDTTLQPSRKRVYFALLSCPSYGGVRKTYAELSAISGCSLGTVRQALADLSAAGYIRILKNYRFSETAQASVRDTNLYILNDQDFSEGYTLVPCKLLKLKITHAAFLVALYLLKLSGMGGRAWPSLRKWFMEELGLAKATICEAIRQLVACNALVKLRCLKANRAFSCNSYILLLWGEGQIPALTLESTLPELPAPETVSLVFGGSIFDKHPVINKITSWLLQTEKRVLSWFRRIFKKRTAVSASP